MQWWWVLAAAICVTLWEMSWLWLTAGILEQLPGPAASAGYCHGAQWDFRTALCPSCPQHVVLLFCCKREARAAGALPGGCPGRVE